jgi:hypothetical protein
MTKNWRYFGGACVAAAIILLSNGAPLLPVLAGLGGATMFMRRHRRNAA